MTRGFSMVVSTSAQRPADFKWVVSTSAQRPADFKLAKRLSSLDKINGLDIRSMTRGFSMVVSTSAQRPADFQWVVSTSAQRPADFQIADRLRLLQDKCV